MLSLEHTPLPESAPSAASSMLRLDGYFGNHAVLERNRTIPVTGYAMPETLVEVTLGTFAGRGIAAPDGRFTVNLPPMPAARNLQLTVQCGGMRLVLDDISIGEVYLAAGQSNMEFRLCDSIPGAEVADDDDFAALRYFKIPPQSYYGRQHTLPGKWQAISRTDADKISGCAFFFGRKIARETGVIIGLIDASLGGINLESWVSRESLLAHPAYRQELLDYERSVSAAGTDDNGKMPGLNAKISGGLKKLFPAPPEDHKFEAGWARPDYDDSDWDSMLLPDSWTEAGHNHAGIFWFRRTIELPDNYAGKELEIHLGAIDKSDRVYFNGTSVGGMGNPCVWDYWATLRVYTVPGNLVKSGRNQITVQAGSMASICTDGGLVGPASEMYLVCKNDLAKRIPLAGEWRYRESFDAGTIGMTFMRTLGAGAPQSLHMLYDNMILPLAGIPMCGVLWYQGEANAICMAAHYESLLCMMLADWRQTLGSPELEFFIVQLPDYHNPHYFSPFNQWALIREAQAHVASQDRYADCIVTIGWGDVVELHPKNKKAVGEAAARCAVLRLNGQMPSQVTLQKLSRHDRTLELTFAGGTLSAIGTNVHGFAIAGEDGKAFAAQAEIITPDTVKVSAPEVPAPTRVWYAWAGNPRMADFQDADGVKVSPFRAALDGLSSAVEAGNLIP